jgi:hypothetical protein
MQRLVLVYFGGDCFCYENAGHFRLGIVRSELCYKHAIHSGSGDYLR